MKISYSAPAKVILSGEHAVVYGKPALVSALDLRLKFSLWSSKNILKDKVILMISEEVKKYLKKKKISYKDKNFDFKIESDIPVKQRLGSSAALCVAASAAFLEFYCNKKFDKETINNIAYQCEKYFHINPSGVDVSASCYGGLIFYRKEFEFLKNISSLNFKLSKNINDGLFLIYSGDPSESTGQMVESVGKLYNQKPQLVEEILNDVEKTTKRMVVAIVKEDKNFFAKSIVDNQVLLEMLGVVSNKAKNLLKRMESFGVGKVTGGGGKKIGSGYILFFTDRKKELEGFLKKNRLNYYKFQQDYLGLQKKF